MRSPFRGGWLVSWQRRCAALVAACLPALLLAAAMLLAAPPHSFARGESTPAAAGGIAQVAVADLPPEARRTLSLIRAGGPFPYDRDGIVFGNREKLLPLRERGWYLEYTVPTPGARNRGARRIVSARSGEFYYTEDHYASFRRIRE